MNKSKTKPKSKKKAVAKKPKKPETAFHVMIPAPKSLRKLILTFSIDAIQLLKRHKNYKEINKRKEKLREELKEIVSNIKSLSKKLTTEDFPLSLKQVLDHPRFKEIEVPKPIAKPVKKTKALKVEKVPKPSKDKLESDLEALRDKLSMI